MQNTSDDTFHFCLQIFQYMGVKRSVGKSIIYPPIPSMPRAKGALKEISTLISTQRCKDSIWHYKNLHQYSQNSRQNIFTNYFVRVENKMLVVLFTAHLFSTYRSLHVSNYICYDQIATLNPPHLHAIETT